MRSLKERIQSYQEITDYKLLSKIPTVIVLNGRSFEKVTSLLDKPFSKDFMDALCATTLKLCSEVEGCILGYCFNDEIVLILKNDQSIDTQPWYNNNIQKICSISSSIATQHFNNYVNSLDLNIINDALFTSNVFNLPNNNEISNFLIYKQQSNFYLSVHFAIFYELLNKGYGKPEIKDMISNLSNDEKISLLYQECNIDFNDYHSSFRKGVAFYKVPNIKNGIIDKNKWFVNSDLPIFTTDHSFIMNIVK